MLKIPIKSKKFLSQPAHLQLESVKSKATLETHNTMWLKIQLKIQFKRPNKKKKKKGLIFQNLLCCRRLDSIDVACRHKMRMKALIIIFTKF